MPKQAVIERMRAAQQWLDELPGHSAAPFGWLRDLIVDAMQEMQSESGQLWMQTTTGRKGHVRIFVEGDMGARELDLLLEILTLHRSWCERDEQPEAADAVDPAPASSVGTSTREKVL